MAFRFLGCGDVLLLGRYALYFLYSTPEVIIQAGSLINQGILICGEPLNSYCVLNIRA
jgi:hypothetical protein